MKVECLIFNTKETIVQFARHALLWLCFPLTVWSQNDPKVTASLDTTAITIGEQIQYSITVEADATALVHFPEGQTFSPLETVEALRIDTLPKENRHILQRKYTLTQFDSGTYTIPPQRIAIDEQPFLTDTFRIQVADVAIDTTKQKLYDIKPLIDVEKSATGLWSLLPWVLLAVILVGSLLYWFVLRKKPLTQAQQEALLPPYDRALLELQKLENSKYLIQEEYKKYYSELTDIIRSYLEEDANISALESTTAQLITKLEMRKEAGQLTLDDNTLTQLQNLLKTADLVKFAKSRPSPTAAEQDRKTVEQIVMKTHEALPQPTQEELLQSQAHIAAQTQKQKRRKLYWTLGIIAGMLILGAGITTAYFGFRQVKDTVLGHSTKTLLESEWISSNYGYPPVVLETPKVLLRQNIPLPPGAETKINQVQMFAYGSYISNFSIAVGSTTYKEAIDPEINVIIEGNLATFEALGIKNITTKQEEFVTKSGIQGLKIYGTGKAKDPVDQKSKTLQYNIIAFGGKGFMQQVIITWEKDDPYAEQIVTRILKSLDVKTQYKT